MYHWCLKRRCASSCWVNSPPVCVCTVIQSCLILYNPLDCSLPGSSAYGIFEERILEQVAISSSRESSQPKNWTCVSWVTESALAGRFFTTEPLGKALSMSIILSLLVLLFESYIYNLTYFSPCLIYQVLEKKCWNVLLIVGFLYFFLLVLSILALYFKGIFNIFLDISNTLLFQNTAFIIYFLKTD